MTLRHQMVWVLFVAIAFWVPAGQAEEPQKPVEPNPVEDLKTGARPAAATLELIMKRAVHNIAARYNLNDVQTEETDKLMKREVYRFLEQHENEVWPIIRDLLAAQLQPPDDHEKMKRIGKAARPLAKLAKEAIFKANEEWRLILTPEQRDMHDFDLEEMRFTFGKIDENFEEWEAGQPTEKGIFPEPRITDRGPPRPTRPPQGRLPEPKRETFDPNRIFATLVEEFIKEYELDKGQITSAKSILEEFKGRANNYREAKKHEFAKIAARQQEAMKNRDLAAVKKADTDRKELLKPVYTLCAEMEDRLKRLLRTEQIQRHAEMTKETEQKPKTPKVAKKASSKTTSPEKASQEKASGSKTETAKTESTKSDSRADSDNG